MLLNINVFHLKEKNFFFLRGEDVIMIVLYVCRVTRDSARSKNCDVRCECFVASVCVRICK